MRRWFRELRKPAALALIAIGPDGASWQRNDGQSGLAPAPAEALSSVGTPAQGVNIVVSNALAVHWMQSIRGVRSLQEARELARMRCAQLHGGKPVDWWVAGDWSADRPFVCAALPMNAMEPVTRLARASRISCRWHTAWSVMAGSPLCKRFDPAGWNVLRSPSRAIAWHCSAGHVDAFASVPLHGEQTREQATQAVQVHIRFEDERAGRPHAPPRWCELAPVGPAFEQEAPVSTPPEATPGESPATLAWARLILAGHA